MPRATAPWEMVSISWLVAPADEGEEQMPAPACKSFAEAAEAGGHEEDGPGPSPPAVSLPRASYTGTPQSRSCPGPATSTLKLSPEKAQLYPIHTGREIIK